MAHHQFRDEHEVLWEAWDVHPMRVERRHADRRRNVGLAVTRQLPLGRAERRRGERRQIAEPRAHAHPEYVAGWVVFQSATERRRLSPIPERWEQLEEHELRTLCTRASPSSRPRRLIE